MRALVLLIVLLFIALLVYLTASEFKHHGVTAAGIVAIVVILLFSIGIVGSLLRDPRE